MSREFELSPEVQVKLEEVAQRFLKITDDGGIEIADSHKETVSAVSVENIYQRSPTVKPEDFLTQKDWTPQVGTLTTEPDIEFMRGLLRQGNQVGLFLIGECWYLARGEENSIPKWLVPRSEVNIHSHITGTEVDFLPDMTDFAFGRENAKNLIVSNLGITHFWPIKDQDILNSIRSVRVLSARSYEGLLNRIGVKFEVHPWRHLTEESLKEVISPSRN